MADEDDTPKVAPVRPPQGMWDDEALPFARHLEDTLTELHGSITRVDKAFNNMASKGAVPAARAFVMLKYLREYSKFVNGRLTVVFEIAKNKTVPEAIDASGQNNVSLKDGFRIAKSMRWTAKILDKAKAFSWLRKNKHGDLIIETINSSTLASFAKSESEEFNRELPAEIFTVDQLPTTSVTKI